MEEAKSASTPYNQNKVRKSLFTWIDILGYTALVKSSNEDMLNELITDLIGTLGRAKENYIAKHAKA